MSEKEKMLAGQLYFAGDGVLVRDRLQCTNWMEKINGAFALTKEERANIIRKGVGHLGENVDIRSPFYCDYGYNIEIGDNVFINYNCVILDCNKVVIGDGTLIGPATQILTANHPTDAKLREQFLEMSAPITIGKNVWIGASALILPGVTIGDNAVIGAGSVVTHDVLENTMVYGNPAAPAKASKLKKTEHTKDK